uniref:Uncharacterized protein n=1 Tax=Medicago truncatula TaxID=3880 RepID=Q2HTA4_MEDTR|nr:hypothetical protein MtrDRAFT_AC150776g2v2 [Medicago truncatula]ABN08911.1 hypothetical protein MtrDRAFT_AC161749g7v2 [Medicago truncatula]
MCRCRQGRALESLYPYKFVGNYPSLDPYPTMQTEGSKWSKDLRIALAILTYVDARITPSRSLNELTSYLKGRFSGKHGLGKTSTFVPNQVMNWFTPLNPTDYQKGILLADIAARNGGFDHVAVPLPHDFAIYLPGRTRSPVGMVVNMFSWSCIKATSTNKVHLLYHHLIAHHDNVMKDDS